MDITSVTAVLGSLKTATEIAKLIKDSDVSFEKAESKLKLADLISALADAKLEVVGVQQAVADAEARIRELEKQLQTHENLKWKEPTYWLEGEGKSDGPFCQKCYDTERKLVRLLGDGTGWYECKACKSDFTTQEYQARRNASIQASADRYRGSY
jgi:hypothetical protein